MTRPARFPAAVTLAVRGHHYFRITEEILEAHAFTTVVRDLIEELQARAARPMPHGVQALEAHLKEVLRPVRRAYERLSAEARALVGDALVEFERHCQGVLRSLNVTSV
jgi:hypothetical protein